MRRLGITATFVFLLGSMLGCAPVESPEMEGPFEATPARLERGQYLVENVADCFGCHSDVDWENTGLPRPGIAGGGGRVPAVRRHRPRGGVTRKAGRGPCAVDERALPCWREKLARGTADRVARRPLRRTLYPAKIPRFLDRTCDRAERAKPSAEATPPALGAADTTGDSSSSFLPTTADGSEAR